MVACCCANVKRCGWRLLLYSLVMKLLQPLPLSTPSEPNSQQVTPALAITERWRQPLPVLFLLLLGTYLRTGGLNDVQYRYDDDALWKIVMQMVRTGQPAMHGLTATIALPNGPFQAYLLAPFGLVGGGAPLMTLGVAFLNILALAIVYAFGRDFFGRRVGLLALLLATVSPWQTVLSRRMLGNDMVAPFAALALWMLCRWLYRQDNRAVVIGAAALAVGGQVYVIGLELLAPAAVALLLGGRRIFRRAVLLALLVFAALVAPYVWTQALPLLGGAVAIHDQTIKSVRFDASALGFAIQMASHDGYQAFATQAGGHLDATSGLPAAFGLLARLLYLLGLGIGLWTLLRGPGRLREERRGVHLLLLTAFTVPVLILLRPTVPPRMLYLVTTFPLPYLYVALALDRLWRWSVRLAPPLARGARAAVVGFVAGTAILDLVLGSIFLSVIGQYWAQSDYGIPWGLNDQTARTSSQLAQQFGAQRILVLDDASDFNMLEWVLAERRAQVADFDDTRMLVLPGRPTLYVAPGNQPAQRTLATAYHQYLLRETRWPGDGTMLRYYLLPPSTAQAPLPAGAIALNWTAGGLIRLDGVLAPARPQPGQAETVQLVMTILKQPPAGTPEFSVFAHLLDAAGNAVAKQDQAAFQTQDWDAGDRVIQSFTLTVPPSLSPGLLSLSVGIYSTNLHGTAIRPLAMTTADGVALGAAGSVNIGAIAPGHVAPASHALTVQFGAGIGLHGYDLRQSGGTLTVTPHWTVSGPVTHGYTAYVHVLDAGGQLIAQNDAPPMAGRFPTTVWQPGDIVPDPHRITLPAGLRPGRYRLAFGLYDSQTQISLPALSGQPEAPVTLTAVP
jgi:4-amino-4-deoxy-L-arabinose transferase-like glycosyltransferase